MTREFVIEVRSPEVVLRSLYLPSFTRAYESWFMSTILRLENRKRRRASGLSELGLNRSKLGSYDLVYRVYLNESPSTTFFVLDHAWSSVPPAVWGDVVIMYPSMRAWLSQGICRGDDDGLWDADLWQLGDWLDLQSPADEPGDGRTNGTVDVYVTSILARISGLVDEAPATIISTRQYVTSHGLVIGASQNRLPIGLISPEQLLVERLSCLRPSSVTG
ncbi:hypothetical protein P175DRAFT_0527351 [Aspergillus ochraceoroseus IBT 24754]|uniref:Alpha-L-rhamnosidase six-hairpin glycosidase domain-containing protein n=1 Tax=Aspergillus ochraceoroseus IBT 24754 TaxID=1392256 RepID=A0A2T5M5T6_9EURO|nr:uncharacterized protein P175DRAFT_0527351 [Aspergillus ochraceoroseus IBT 24754]PTU23894.1 hypothetical protein P175DRAFT_0527351 [Aspergillus ochraceoroseus IBT 24754]